MKTQADKLFASHVTSVAFHLALSRSMIGVLADVAQRELGGSPYVASNLRKMGLRDTWVGTARCLVDRGLIESRDPEWPGVYSLTDAGRHVVALLQIAELVAIAEQGNYAV